MVYVIIVIERIKIKGYARHNRAMNSGRWLADGFRVGNYVGGPCFAMVPHGSVLGA